MASIGIVWLGYVGLPLAYHFDQAGHNVIGYDISTKKIDELNKGIDSTNEIGDKISQSNIEFTLDISKLKNVEYIIVTVPTPINSQKTPEFRPLQKSSEAIGQILQPGQIVVYESTVYPGCTEEICLPILEEISGLSAPSDFQIGYSPERINPGDKTHTVDKIVKVVAGSTPEVGQKLAALYGSIITAGIHIAPSIAVAEAAKIIENTQRDINIALMNELKKIFDAAGISIWDVLEAAKTKWNFINFYPGLVGGHCIGVDPYWLAYKAQWLNLNPEMILAGRRTNDEFAKYLAAEFVKAISQLGISPNQATVLILGLTFKPNVPDFRNSKVAEFITELKEYGISISAYDPYHQYLRDGDYHEFGLEKSDVLPALGGKFSVVLQAVDHAEFDDIDMTPLLKSGTSYFLRLKDIGVKPPINLQADVLRTSNTPHPEKIIKQEETSE